jgi:hypothetical protein
MTRLPAAVPLACGANITLKDLLCPAANDTGKDKPLTTNSGLVTLSDEMVAGAPLAVSVAVWLLLAPTGTLPKLSTVGERISCPEPPPDPVSGTERLESVALDTAHSVPEAAPAAAGRKWTVNVTLSDGVRVIGVAISETVNTPPDAPT